MRRTLLAVAGTIAAVSFSQIALAQIDIRGRGVTGDVTQTNQTTTQEGTGNQATTQSGTENQASNQSGTGNQNTQQQGTTNQSTEQSGTSNQSTTQMGRDNQSTNEQTAAGPTDNPNVTRDAQGREHENKGKHKGWEHKQQSRDEDRSRSGRY
jgi:hypothetical protein